MLEVLDINGRKTAILENAFDISEEIRINAISSLRFSLPESDAKNKYCVPFAQVRLSDGELYRIMPCMTESGSSGVCTYNCEHILATLMDDVLLGYQVVGNIGYYTERVIQYILEHQTVKRWKLGECDFKRQFEYGWENESLLSALFSVPNCFVEGFVWRMDTRAFPWTLHLKRLDENALPEMYIRAHKNLLQLTRTSDPREICTRLYPLGYGEGVNQLGIAEVNNGLPYLQSPPELVTRYGLISRVWIDRRYEDAASLKAAGEAMLAELQEPYTEYSVELAEIGQGSLDRAGIGKIVQIDYPETSIKVKSYITGISRSVDNPESDRITIANRPQDIASTVADLADRQRIEMSYSQGATNLYAQSLQANADSKTGAVLEFYIPSEMRIVNKVIAKISMDRFRAYSKATEGGGQTSTTSSAGGGSTQTSSSGGGGSTTSASGGGGSITSNSGGGNSLTSSAGGSLATTVDGVYIGGINDGDGETSAPHGEGDEHTHTYYLIDHYHRLSMPSHRHDVDVPSHNHSVNLPTHTHSVSLPTHSHSVKIPNHTHDFSIPAHTHAINPGIFRFGNPRSFRVLVNGVQRVVQTGSGAELNLTDYLVKNGRIPRGTWHKVEIIPDDLAYISIDMFVQGFVQSRGDNTV